MKAIEILKEVFRHDLSNDKCGIFEISKNVIDEICTEFGDCNIVISPLLGHCYLYEWVKIEFSPTLEYPDAILTQPSSDGSMIIYLYNIE